MFNACVDINLNQRNTYWADQSCTGKQSVLCKVVNYSMIYEDRFFLVIIKICHRFYQIISLYILFQVKKEARRYFLIINPIRLIAIYIMDYINKIISMIHNPFGIILNLTMLIIITSLKWLSNTIFLFSVERFSKQLM